MADTTDTKTMPSAKGAKQELLKPADPEWPPVKPIKVTYRLFVYFCSWFGIEMRVRDVSKEDKAKRKETRFFWIDRLEGEEEEKFLKGVARDDRVRQLPRLGAYWWPREDPKLGADDLVGLFFHGGAYAAGSAYELDGSARIPRNLVKRGFIKQIVSTEYRLTDRSPFPGQLIDAIQSYVYLVNHHHIPPSRILLIGDSAGGHLVLSLMRYLVDEQVLALPRGVLLLSPWCDMSSGSIKNNLAKYLNDLVHPFLGHHPPAQLASSPYFSPAVCPTPPDAKDGKLFPPSIWPPTFIAAGEVEFLYDQIQVLVKRMNEDGVDVTYVEGNGMDHDYLTSEGTIFDKRCKSEREVLYKALEDWFKKVECASA